MDREAWLAMIKAKIDAAPEVFSVITPSGLYRTTQREAYSWLAMVRSSDAGIVKLNMLVSNIIKTDGTRL